MSATILLTVEETGVQLRIARRRVFELLRDGTLSSVKIGRSRGIRSTDLVAYVAELENDIKSPV